MSHLLREQVPISDAGWRLLDSEAEERLTPGLAARQLVDFAGSHGWQHSATNLGRTQELSDPPEKGVTALQRRVLGLVELRARFSVARSELEDAERGAEDVDLAALDKAAKRIARAENTVVFNGWSTADIAGVVESSTHDKIALGEDQTVQGRIEKLIEEEQALREAGEGKDPEDSRQVQLESVKLELDRCWDLLRQRRAREEFDQDPDDAQARESGTVEGYLQ